jgi:hypothetical protein
MKTTIENSGKTLRIDACNSFAGFCESANTETQENTDWSKIDSLFVTGSYIDDFELLKSMPKLKKLVLLACKSDFWNKLRGTPTIKILRLHNLNAGKGYLDNIDFIQTFSGLEYLYLNMLGITAYPDMRELKKLHTIVNILRKLEDFRALEFAPALKTFIGNPAVDKQKTPAEAFIPILKNPSLEAFSYPQFRFKREHKKLESQVAELRPDINSPMYTFDGYFLNNNETRKIVAMFF